LEVRAAGDGPGQAYLASGSLAAWAS
jgi:hypothetical protein